MQLKFYFRKKKKRKYYISCVSIKLGQKKKKKKKNSFKQKYQKFVRMGEAKLQISKSLHLLFGVSGSRDYELNINEHFMDSDRVIVKSN